MVIYLVNDYIKHYRSECPSWIITATKYIRILRKKTRIGYEIILITDNFRNCLFRNSKKF